MLHSDPDRRFIVAGAGLLALLAKPATAAGNDAELVRLGAQLDAAWSEQVASDKADNDIDEPHERACEIAHRIEQMQATTIAGLIVKARACSWCHGGEPFEPDFFSLDGHPTTDLRLAASVFRDLLALSGRPVPVS